MILFGKRGVKKCMCNINIVLVIYVIFIIFVNMFYDYIWLFEKSFLIKDYWN